jgi:cytochrome P450
MRSVHEFAPFAPETLEDPYPFYAAMRREAPVFEAAPGVFFVASYERVNEVLRDTERFSSGRGAAFLNFQGEEGLAPPSAPPPELAAILRKGVEPRDTMLSADPPAHTRYRSLVNRSLSPRRVTTLEPAVRSVANELIDGFLGRGEAEFVSQYTMLVPLTVVSLALGVPPSELERYKDWSIRVVSVLARSATPEERLDSARASVELTQYLASRVEDARRSAGDDLIGDLVNAHLKSDDSDAEPYRALDTPEIVSIVNQLLVAGQETVNYLLSSLMLNLLRNPDQLRALMADPALIPRAIEEGMRHESPIQALGRFVVEDTELGGAKLPGGSRLVILYGSANRDESVFPDADRIDIHRENLREHLAFGAGPHYCVGAALARLESRIALEELFQRARELRLAPDKNDFTHQYNFIFRALKSLHVELLAA